MKDFKGYEDDESGDVKGLISLNGEMEKSVQDHTVVMTPIRIHSLIYSLFYLLSIVNNFFQNFMKGGKCHIMDFFDFSPVLLSSGTG